jgi:hypothetical protein
MRGTLTMNWGDNFTATQNRAQWRYLMYEAVENRKNQKE